MGRKENNEPGKWPEGEVKLKLMMANVDLRYTAPPSMS